MLNDVDHRLSVMFVLLPNFDIFADVMDRTENVFILLKMMDLFEKKKIWTYIAMNPG